MNLPDNLPVHTDTLPGIKKSNGLIVMLYAITHLDVAFQG
jgi:hypothetical protein